MGCCGDDDEDRVGEKRSLKPIKERHRKQCTDCLCLLIFIIFLAGMGLITALTVMDNGFQRLILGYDSHGNLCNHPNTKTINSTHHMDTTGLPYVFMFNYTDPLDTRKMCVKSCPSITIDKEQDFINYTRQNNYTLCEYGVKPGIYERAKCPRLPIIKAYAIANRCVPDMEALVTEKLIDQVGDQFEAQLAESKEIASLYVVQVYDNLPKIGVLAIASLLITIMFVVLLRYIARTLVFLIMAIAALGSIAASAFLWWKFSELVKNGSVAMTSWPLVGELQLVTAFLVYAIVVTVLTVILLLIIFIMRTRINLVIKLVGEAQKTLIDIPVLFVLPILTILILIMFVVYWLLTALMIYSYGEYNTIDLVMFGMSIKKVTVAKVMWVYHLIALIWVSEFIFACQAMVISGSVARWYFTRDRKRLSAPVCVSLSHLLTYHMGSVAFGSFIITLIRFPRYVLMAIERKLKTLGPDSIVSQMLKGCMCCLWCLEKFMQYVNANAYTIIAIEGVSFCVATKKSFLLIMKNALRCAMINSVGDFLLLLCKIAVTVLSLGLAIWWLQIPLTDLDSVKSSSLPLIMVAVIAFLISHCFFTVYEMVIDALMVCFCEDMEANDGSEERPYYMSQSLKAFVDESDKVTIRIHGN